MFFLQIFKDLSLWEKQKIPALQIGMGIPDPVFCAEEARFSKHVLQVIINFSCLCYLKPAQTTVK